MNKRFNYIGVCFGMAALLFVSCDQEQEVSPVMDATTKPLITIERTDGGSSTVSEGDVLVYTISTNKMMTSAVDFSAEMAEAIGVDDHDVVIEGARLLPYTTSTTMTVTVVNDNFPELGENLEFDITAPSLGQNWQLNPNSDVEKVKYDIQNVNDPNALTVGFTWDDPEHVTDFDLLVESVEEGSWSAAGATGDNPEVDASIRHDYDEAYDGTYYVGFDPYDVPEGDIPFKVHVGYPDGTVEIFEGTFNVANLASYDFVEFTAWGIPMYKLVTVVKSGDSYTVTYNFQ